KIEPGAKSSAASLPAALPAIPNSPTDPSAMSGAASESPGAGVGAVLEQDDGSIPAFPPASAGWSPEVDQSWRRRFAVGEYDDDLGAFVLVRPDDPAHVPFELTLDVVTQARFTSFARRFDSWTDSTGTRRPVQNYDSVEVTRNFLVFSG